MNTSKYVEVTQDDIDKGKREDSESCPIGLALHRELDLSFAPDVDDDDTTLHRRSQPFYRDSIYGHDRAITAWVRDFDAGRPVSPITIEMTDDPDERVEGWMHIHEGNSDAQG